MQFLGPPFTFGLEMISDNTTIMGPNSAIAVDDNIFWMGVEDFYVYTGRVQKLPCTVREFVFSDFNRDQADKVMAGINSAFNEVWWFYPSSSSQNNDRYVVYNYQLQIWYFGELSRSAWMDRGIRDFPIAAHENYLYFHELGYDDGSTTPASAISSYIESSIVLKARNFPGGDYLQSETSSITRSSLVPVEQYTNQAHVRLRGRSVAVRAQSSGEGVKWRLGSPRLDVRPDGRR